MELPLFTFSITTTFKDCLSSQIGEALQIQYSPDIILNSKSEYFDNCITRLTIEESQWERRERETRSSRKSCSKLRWSNSRRLLRLEELASIFLPKGWLKLMMMTYLWVGIYKPDNVGCPGGKTNQHSQRDGYGGRCSGGQN